MRKKRIYVNRILSVVLLMVFAIALTPFSALHHHEEEHPCAAAGKVCAHTVHIHSHSDHCLICAVHFEKDYTKAQDHFQVCLVSSQVMKNYSTCSGSYISLISTSLRGPPIV